MNMYMCMKINYINSPFIKLKDMASLCSHSFIGYAGLPRRTTGISEASSIMRALSSARCTDVRLYTLRIKIGTNQRALGELSHY